jgi:basic amino acid/polyamine antiporter, APA family
LIALLEFTAPVFWLFFLLPGGSLIVLRLRKPICRGLSRCRCTRLLPLLLCAVCAFMLRSSLPHVRSQARGSFNAA